MKAKTFKILIFIFIMASKSQAAPYYIFIEKFDSGSNERGDVVTIVPATAQYEPTRAERDLFFIIESEVNNDDRNRFLERYEEDEEYFDEDGNTYIRKKILKSRKYKILVNEIPINKLKQSVAIEKINENLLDKSVVGP